MYWSLEDLPSVSVIYNRLLFHERFDTDTIIYFTIPVKTVVTVIYSTNSMLFTTSTNSKIKSTACFKHVSPTA
jgi:hypothetical protein